MTNIQKQEIGAFLTRLSLGVILLAHGLLKLLVFKIDGTVQFFESLGHPPIFAYLTIFGEIAGGAALILGIYPRLTAILSLPILVGATITHINNGWVFSNANGGWEFPALLVVLAIIVAVQNSKKFAIKKLPIIDCLIPEILKN